MSSKLPKIMVAAVAVLAVLAILSDGFGGATRAAGPGGGGGGRGRGRGQPPADTGPRTLSPYFTPATPGTKTPDADGFLQRWMLLEPINNNLNGNTGFTESFVSNAFKTQNFPDQ